MRLSSLRVMVVIVGLCLLDHIALSDPEPHWPRRYRWRPDHEHDDDWNDSRNDGANAAGGAGGSSNNKLANSVVVEPVIVLPRSSLVPTA